VCQPEWSIGNSASPPSHPWHIMHCVAVRPDGAFELLHHSSAVCYRDSTVLWQECAIETSQAASDGAERLLRIVSFSRHHMQQSRG
jgi:hypothetical protein